MAYGRPGRPKKYEAIQQEFEELKDPDLQVAESFDPEPTYEPPKDVVVEKEIEPIIKNVLCVCTTACWISSIPKLFIAGDLYEFPENSIPKYFKISGV